MHVDYIQIEISAYYALKNYKNKLKKIVQTEKLAPGAPVLDPPLLIHILIMHMKTSPLTVKDLKFWPCSALISCDNVAVSDFLKFWYFW